jgi:maltooligosyltrehalose trehalohydrolase
MSHDLGAVWLDDRKCRFSVWSPLYDKVELHIVAPDDRIIPMRRRHGGYHQLTVEGLLPDTQYVYRLDSTNELPDPASRHQPHGVNGPSQVVSRAFPWTDQKWFGIPIESYLIYELHTGTFTPEGTFDAIIPHIPYLVEVGFTALELMPVAQFPGERNWGYDGVFPFAAQNTYGGPAGLKRLVNACHERGMAVILDVVYNHLGPEGNYFSVFAPYFTNRYKTPWGPALNFDDAHSDEVRHFFIQNALYWLTECHIDALRLDAVHAILDHSALNFLEELAERVHQLGTEVNRRVYTIAESALNDTRLIRSTELGGYAIDAQWNDDFHHSLHTLLTREHQGYYSDFGNFQHMAQAFSEGFVYSGRYSANRGRRHGNSSRSIPSHKFVVYAQNHDQIGNRMVGDRLSQLISFEKFKLAEAITLLSPFIPLIFMGDEYGETAPFQYFVSHSDSALVEAVRSGRKEEFASFGWTDEPPDPQDEQTFKRSKLNHALRNQTQHRILLDFHKEVIRLRKSLPALACMCKETMDVITLDSEQTLIVRRWNSDNEVLTLFNFNEKPFELVTQIPGSRWQKVLDSADRCWGGKGSSIPAMLEASGTTRLQLTPAMVLVFIKETEA